VYASKASQAKSFGGEQIGEMQKKEDDDDGDDGANALTIKEREKKRGREREERYCSIKIRGRERERRLERSLCNQSLDKLVHLIVCAINI
jgi:hypothetical protein